MTMRVGMGFDAHPFGGDRPLRLGGLELPGSSGLLGHSDGDVLLHALADALLGAAGLGSLGEQFPDSDEAWRGADSSRLLARVFVRIRQMGFSLGNADVLVIAETPKIAPHRESLRQRVAEILEVPAERINVRGTSSNGLGFAGRGDGIAAVAVALLEKAES